VAAHFCANSLLRSEGWRGRSTSGSWALLIPLHQLILCSGAFFPPVAFDCLGLPPASCGDANTRRYMNGWRCIKHIPAAVRKALDQPNVRTTA
jgi:hypothetical protein